MWLVGKVARRVEAVVARRKGLTPEQYEANKPIFRFDLGGWPFQKQGRSERREFNAWILLVGVTSAYMLGKYLSTLGEGLPDGEAVVCGVSSCATPSIGVVPGRGVMI